MLNFSKTKIILIYLTFLLISFFSFSNFTKTDNILFQKKINLGLDLQGGSYLLLEVDSSSIEKRRLQSRVIPLKKELNKNSIKFNNFLISDYNIKFKINNDDIDKFKKIFEKKNDNQFNIFLPNYNSFE